MTDLLVGEINRDSAIPLYHQLKHILLNRIRLENLREGDRFWSDYEVVNTYGVSRSVVRQALAELESEGVVQRIRGRGTFIAPRTTDHGLAKSLDGLFAYTKKRGLTLVSRVLRNEIIPAGDVVADLLKLPLGSPVFLLQRTRYVSGTAWATSTSWVPVDRVPGIEEVDFESESLYARMQDGYGITFCKARRSLEAVAATEATASKLGIVAGSAVLMVKSVMCDELDIPVEAFIAFHRGDISRFDIELAAENSSVQMHMVNNHRGAEAS